MEILSVIFNESWRNILKIVYSIPKKKKHMWFSSVKLVGKRTSVMQCVRPVDVF